MRLDVVLNGVYRLHQFLVFLNGSLIDQEGHKPFFPLFYGIQYKAIVGAQIQSLQ